ncbi:MAG TPA: hypothetical protein VM689_27230 [Aliidongia sp.]|nr:hypothetical protein [Aliidongia sp.]
MINSIPKRDPAALSEADEIDAIVRGGPGGALVLAGLATAIVVALWLAFYFIVFLGRVATP